MAKIHLHLPSFNAGELSPLLGARFAVEKVASGCRRLRNFLIHVHGPAFRRPGMEHMGANAGNGAKSRLMGFNFSTTTGFILELHPSGLQVWSNGVRIPLVSPVALPYSETECAEVQMAQVNDVCYLAHPNHMPRRLVRYADNDWRLAEVPWKWPAMGDESVRATDASTTEVTTLETVATERWPEFTVVAGAYTFAVTGPDLTGLLKKARLEKWAPNAGEWQTLQTITWRGVAPATVTGTFAEKHICRMTYEGPTSGGAITTSWIGGGTASMSLVIEQPESRQPITVPAGDWRAVVECANKIPADARLMLQKQKGDGSWIDYQELYLKAGQTINTRGAYLDRETVFRFSWTGRAMAGTARIESLEVPASSAVTVAASNTTGEGRTLTASRPLFTKGDIGSYWQLAHRRDNSFSEIVAPDIVGGGDGTINAVNSSAIRVSGKWDVFTYGTWDATLYLEQKVNGTWRALRSWSSNKDRNVIASGNEDSEIEMRLRVTAGTSSAATGAAVPRFVLEAAESRVYGLVKITAVGALDADGKATTATADVIKTIHSTDATDLWTEGAWSGAKGYPRTVALHGQRLWFGGTRAEPLRLWGSMVNDYHYFRRTSLDDASVSFTPAAQQSNQLQWMVSHGQDLILGTNGDEWTLSADGGVITPVSVQMQRRSGYGSQYQTATLLGEVVVFVQRGGRKLRQVAPRSDGTVWSAADLTVLAEHVARAGVTQIAVQNFPYSILWAVTTEGQLLAMTFEQEQNVFGWTVHDTDGAVESVAVVYGVEADEVWLSVSREGKRSVERLDPAVFARRFDAPERMIYLDSATRFESASPMQTLIGLNHLEGRTVSVLGDGAELAQARVIGGEITLEVPVRTAIVGLPFLSELQPMRVEIPLQDGTAQHRKMKVARVGLFLHESLGGEISDGLTSKPEKLNFRRSATAMDGVPPLFSGEIETPIESRAGENYDVVIRQRAPLPLNIGSITLKGDLYGE